MATLRECGRSAAACVLMLGLAACGRESADEMSWARAALERNKQIEIVATDSQSHTFTVRVRDSNDLLMVRADQLIGAPPLSASSAAVSNSTSAAAAPAAPPAPAAAPAAPATAAAPAAAGESASAEPPAAEVAETAPHAQGPGQVLRSGPGYSIEAAGNAAPRKVSVEGPGYSVKSSGGRAPPAARGRDPSVTSAAVERRHEPIVCQGSRLLHIDNRNLEFDGDAVSAEDGCEIHITNSRITATGVGVLARAANVHIDNSLIEGDAGSIDASEGAQVYAASTHFRGLSRRLDNAAFHDLGGNVWN